MGSLPTLVSTIWPFPSRTRYSSETTRPNSTRMSPPPDEAGHAAEGGEPVVAGRSGGLRSAGPGEEKDRGGGRQRGAQPERRSGRDVVPQLACQHRRDEEAEARHEIVKSERATAPVLRHRRGDERALGALGQAGDQPVGGEQRPGLPRIGGDRTPGSRPRTAPILRPGRRGAPADPPGAPAATKSRRARRGARSRARAAERSGLRALVPAAAAERRSSCPG